MTSDHADPAAIVAARGDLRLALVASLQYLPARQRAVLILRDVLAFPAAEVAAMLGTTTASVKSALQRARAALRELAPAADEIQEPTEPRARTLLDQYIAACRTASWCSPSPVRASDGSTRSVTLGWWRHSGSSQTGRIPPTWSRPALRGTPPPSC